jgi:glycerol-3-phosphate dehydrogenase
LLGVLNRAFPDRVLTRADVVGAQAGLRPLVYTEGPTARASREEKVWERGDGVLVLGGGKLTTYRRTAEKVARHLMPGAGPSPTATIGLEPVPDADVGLMVRETQARELGDVLARRTRRLLLDHKGALADAESLAKAMGKALRWSPARRKQALARFADEAAQYGLPEWSGARS